MMGFAGLWRWRGEAALRYQAHPRKSESVVFFFLSPSQGIWKAPTSHFTPANKIPFLPMLRCVALSSGCGSGAVGSRCFGSLQPGFGVCPSDAAANQQERDTFGNATKAGGRGVPFAFVPATKASNRQRWACVEPRSLSKGEGIFSPNVCRALCMLVMLYKYISNK